MSSHTVSLCVTVQGGPRSVVILRLEIISSKALGLKVATLGFRSGFLVAAATKSGEAG